VCVGVECGMCGFVVVGCVVCVCLVYVRVCRACGFM